jgi:D-amino-acid oxidase
MARVTVVGAGVIGLTTADALADAGHDVRVVAAALGPGITSAAAGAIWFPFRSDPPTVVNRWASMTRAWESMLAATCPEAGVDVLRLESYANTPERPWWSGAVDDLGPPIIDRPEAPYVWRFAAPRVEPATFCAWLERRLAGRITIGRVASLDEVEGDVVVNCTGLGARSLCGDTSLKGVWGQTTIVAADGLDLSLSISDERDESTFFYSIPRRGEVVLGGCAIEEAGESPTPPTEAWRKAILDRAAAHGLRVQRVLRDSSGLRPYRSAVRLEREGRVIHNYGHGGSGYTLCRGCALDVVQLVAT